MSKGRVTKIGPGPDGKLLATVELEGVEGSIDLPYWPELLEQWGADKLRGHLLAQAAAAVIDTDAHEAVIGEGEPLAVEPEPFEQPSAPLDGSPWPPPDERNPPAADKMAAK